MPYRLARLPAGARVAVAGFVVLVLGLHVAAQATLWVTAGRGSLPAPGDVLDKYHGRPDRTVLHDVLDVTRPSSDPRAMYLYLDAMATPDDMARVRERRTTILAWVEEGAARDGWEAVRHVLHDEAMCIQCHGFGGEKHRDVPLETYEQVRRLARPRPGMPLGALLTSAHNHVFAFAVLALLLGLATAFTTVRRSVAVAVVLAAFVGAGLDVLSWFLTRAAGAPWQYGVFLGGLLFGVATGLMGAIVLDEVLLRGGLARRLGLARGEATRRPPA